MSAARRSRASGDGDDLDRPVVITRARQSYEEELAARKRRYFLLMSVRIPALFLAGIAYMIWHNGWIALAIVGGSIPIPWIAVVGANDRPPLPKDEPRPYAGASGFAVPQGYALPAAVTGSQTADQGADTPPRDPGGTRDPAGPRGPEGAGAARPAPSPRPAPDEPAPSGSGDASWDDVDVSGHRPPGSHRVTGDARRPAGPGDEQHVVIDAED